MWKRKILTVPLSIALLGAAAATGHASPSHDHTSTPSSNPQAATVVAARFDDKASYFQARLSGRNEVPAPGGKAVNDPDGSAVAIIKVKGPVVSFALGWKGMQAPSLIHIHQGRPGVNGDVKANLTTTALPESVTAAAGAVNVSDPAALDALRGDPSGFYVNLHTPEFPGGAVRGQLTALNRPVDLMSVVRAGSLSTFMDGGQEVPVAGKPAVGDPDGFASNFLKVRETELTYGFVWVGIAPPTLGHIHQGKAGTNGDVKVPLFTTPVPAGIFAITGTVGGVDRELLKNIRSNPAGFYTNLHTVEFPGGAVRGQIHKTPRYSGD
ncbi:hypothetical protein GCM10010193_64120 [Kitasatospora atroaurantiaca]|uniref:CHRD domain-containing protein n=1 Tax=Kitasatospora atroaurantiaca TaxID=285545 RepID=A0A561F1M7_9ACTN|nr:CHRD domain-containing protein [Kitasatospora atroaurantiaca]TWE21770.1 CHRD domain-containing protein [Kitasatospora atroaurantiaca]